MAITKVTSSVLDVDIPAYKSFGTNSIMIGDTTTGTINAADQNTGLGVDVFAALTEGDNNVAVGYGALSTNSSGIRNVAVGRGALGTNNGSYSTAVGDYSLANNTTGRNTAFGIESLFANTTGFYNTALGDGSLYANTEGTYNTAVGAFVLDANTTGTYNTALGYSAGGAITIGYNNICLGYNAGNGPTTMHTNILIGVSAGSNMTSGDRNIIIGENVNPAGGTDYRSININTQGASGKGSGTGFLSAGAASGMYQGNNTTTWATTSDRRIKKNIVDNTDGLNKINNIQVKNFEYRTKEEIEELGEECAIEKEGVQLGVIAQELQTILPDCVTQESTGCFTVNADNITWYLVNAVKELSSKVEELESRLGD
jgi:hypothetical protein